MAYPNENAPAPQRVALDAILMEREFQPRREGEPDPATVKRYANAYRANRPLPPVTLVRWNDALVLADGWHRVMARRRIGAADVEAVVRKAASLEEVKWIAAEANMTHGRPLRSSEHREVFRAYVRAGKHKDRRRYKSYREIADELHGARAHTTIRGWMKRDFPRIANEMGDRGDQFRETGGLYGQGHSSEDTLLWGAEGALETVVNAVKALSSEEHRGKLIVALEAALVDLKSRPHLLPPPEDIPF